MGLRHNYLSRQIEKEREKKLVPREKERTWGPIGKKKRSEITRGSERGGRKKKKKGDDIL